MSRIRPFRLPIAVIVLFASFVWLYYYNGVLEAREAERLQTVITEKYSAFPVKHTKAGEPLSLGIEDLQVIYFGSGVWGHVGRFQLGRYSQSGFYGRLSELPGEEGAQFGIVNLEPYIGLTKSLVVFKATSDSISYAVVPNSEIEESEE